MLTFVFPFFFSRKSLSTFYCFYAHSSHSCRQTVFRLGTLLIVPTTTQYDGLAQNCQQRTRSLWIDPRKSKKITTSKKRPVGYTAERTSSKQPCHQVSSLVAEKEGVIPRHGACLHIGATFSLEKDRPRLRTGCRPTRRERHHSQPVKQRAGSGA